MNNEITPERLKKYFEVTSEALEIVKQNVAEGKESQAKEILNMVHNYLSDAHHFEEKGEVVDAFAALNYAHGWIDAGVRLDIFEVDDDRLFTVK